MKAILDHFGFKPILERWVSQLVTPFAKLLFPHFGGDSLDSHHGFVVEYKLGKDIDLGFHVGELKVGFSLQDDSEITLNLCLGKEFTGGGLYFKGVRCNHHTNTPSNVLDDFDYVHSKGNSICR